jgi:hypothetical protein
MHPFNRQLRLLGTALTLVLGLALGASHALAQPAEVLADRLAKLRSEVEGLSEQLAEGKTHSRNELQSRARQKSDLQLELDREEVRLSKLRSVLQEKKRRIEESSERGDDLRPVFELGLSGMRDYVKGSLPFRRAERLAELDKLEEQQRSGILTYGKALVRLWSFVEDELRMSRENASFQQTIELEGEEKLVQVLRIGMVMLYFETSEGSTGFSRFSNGKWDFVRAFGPKQSKQIMHLFDSFKKQIRVGLFRIPNALPAVQK